MDDVRGELWITATDLLASKKGVAIDFSNPEHREWILAYTYQRLVRYTEITVRRAVSFDSGHGEEDGLRLIERLASGEKDNPADLVVECEDETGRVAGLWEGESVGAAWLVLLERCGGSMGNVSYFLKLSLSHTYRCYQKARMLAESQETLPLGRGGKPGNRVGPWRRFRLQRRPEQLMFDFDPELRLEPESPER